MENKIEMDLLQDFAELSADFLEHYGFACPAVTNPKEVLFKSLSFKHRLIPIIPRVIHKPMGFACPSQYADALASLETKITAGEDLFPYQSRKIIDVNYKDRLLNDWGIQHLHLGTEMEVSRPLIKGTSEVLFVYFQGSDAYFITIAAHDTWTDQDMIRVLHDNFPNSIESWRPNDVVGLTHAPSDSEVKTLRKAGINSALEIYPGVVYLGPGGGLASDGTSMQVSREVIGHVRMLRNMEKQIREKETDIRNLISDSTRPVPEILRFKLLLDGSRHVIIETTTDIVVYESIT